MQFSPVNAAAGGIGAIEQRLAITHDSRARLALIVGFVRELLADNPRYAAGLATEGYHLATTLRDLPAMAMLMEDRGRAYFALAEYRVAIADLEEAYRYCDDMDDDDGRAGAAQMLGAVRLELGEHTEALEWLRRAIDGARTDAARGVRARALHSLGDLRLGIGDYPAALEQYLESMALRIAIDDQDGIGDVHGALGVLYARTGDHALALEHLTRSVETFRATGNRLAEVRMLRSLAEAHYAAGSLEDALTHGLRALTIYEALGDAENAGRVMTIVGKVHESRGEHDVAIRLLMRAYAHLSTSRDDALRVDILTAIGRLHVRTEAYDDALFVLDQALRMAQVLDDPHLQQEIHKAFADTYEILGRTMQALEHYKRFAAMRDELAGRQKQGAIAELQIRFHVTAAERERETYRLRAQELETEMRLKGNELAAMALHLVQKKELLEQMRTRLADLQAQGPTPLSAAIDGIIAEIDATTHSDADWKRFEEQMDHLHQDFIRTLSERYPKLTPAELKICSLARLDLSTKDIANLLYTSTRTIDAHKYKIRRKLSLDSKISLTTFLAGL